MELTKNTLCKHHKNRNHSDNRLENLEIMTLSEHTKHHGLHGHIHQFKLANIPPNKKLPPVHNLSWCSGCQKFLPITEFTKDHTKWDGLRTYCKTCRRKTIKRTQKQKQKQQEYNKEYYLRYRENLREKHREWGRKWRIEHREKKTLNLVKAT